MALCWGWLGRVGAGNNNTPNYRTQADRHESAAFKQRHLTLTVSRINGFTKTRWRGKEVMVVAGWDFLETRDRRVAASASVAVTQTPHEQSKALRRARGARMEAW